MLKDRGDFSETLSRLFPEENDHHESKHVFTFTFQVTTACSLNCTYCYQTHKGNQMMSWDIAKKTVDYIFDSAENPESILSYDKVLGIIIDFIGGEPLLNIDLISKIIDYFEEQLLVRESPWLFKHKYSFSTNGVSYFDNRVQEMVNKYGDVISMGVTVDGHKELHDKCRLFPDGSGSYDLAIKASLDQKDRFGNDHTKITLCPDNIAETSKAIINMLSLGYRHIHANCVYEDGWNIEHAGILYREMKKIADYVLENDLEDKCLISLYSEDDFSPLDDTDTANWCGGTGKMLAVDYKGDFYPCIRFMESSIGTKHPPLVVGNCVDGAYCSECGKKLFKDLTSITRQSQSTDECLTCRVAKGCSWCSGFNYQEFGTANKRATYICIMHKARALGNWYYWKMEAKKKCKDCQVRLYLPEDEAINIIGKDEWSDLIAL